MGSSKEKILPRSFIPIETGNGKSFALRIVPAHFGEVNDEGFLVTPEPKSKPRTGLAGNFQDPHTIGQAFTKFENRQAWRSAPCWGVSDINRSSFLKAELSQGERTKTECQHIPLEPQNGAVWVFLPEFRWKKPGEVVNLTEIPCQIGFTLTPEGRKIGVGVPIRLESCLKTVETEEKERKIKDFIEETKRFTLDKNQLERAVNLDCNHNLHLELEGELRFKEKAVGQQLITRLSPKGLDRLVVVRVAEKDRQDPRYLRVGTRLALVDASPRFHSLHPEVGNPQENFQRCFGNPELTLKVGFPD